MHKLKFFYIIKLVSYCKICNKKVEEKCPDCNKKNCECESEDDNQDIVKIKMYCLKCRKHTISNNLEKIDADGKIQLKADCTECNARKYRFVSKEGEEKI